MVGDAVVGDEHIGDIAQHDHEQRGERDEQDADGFFHEDSFLCKEFT